MINVTKLNKSSTHCDIFQQRIYITNKQIGTSTVEGKSSIKRRTPDTDVTINVLNTIIQGLQRALDHINTTSSYQKNLTKIAKQIQI